jgi:hypothetical protein
MPSQFGFGLPEWGTENPLDEDDDVVIEEDEDELGWDSHDDD